MNRKRARKNLQEKLDVNFNGENSYIMKTKRKQLEKRKKSKKRTKDRLEKLKALKEQQDADTL